MRSEVSGFGVIRFDVLNAIIPIFSIVGCDRDLREILPAIATSFLVLDVKIYASSSL